MESGYAPEAARKGLGAPQARDGVVERGGAAGAQLTLRGHARFITVFRNPAPQLSLHICRVLPKAAVAAETSETMARITNGAAVVTNKSLIPTRESYIYSPRELWAQIVFACMYLCVCVR